MSENKEYLGNLEVINKCIEELQLFSKVNNLDIDIKIKDTVNNNTRLVYDIVC